MLSEFTTSHFNLVAGKPNVRGRIRREPADFKVSEDLGFAPDGAGEHVVLRIRKTGLNTMNVVGRLSRLTGVKERDIGYSGLKDKNAISDQWLSVVVRPDAESDWTQLNSEQVEVLDVQRHGRKIRRGTHRANEFRIRVTELDGDPTELEERLQRINEQGVPNYFGEQRFGFQGANVDKARWLFEGKLKERRRCRSGIYLSAARSWLFNQILSERVVQGTWNRYLSGDVLMFDGKHSFFKPDPDDPDIEQRIERFEVHPTGALWGKGKPIVSDEVAELEKRIAGEDPELVQGLEKAGLKQERRALRLVPGNLEWEFESGNRSLNLSFDLPTGCFATSVLRELLNYSAEAS